ncbi:MAG: hypothetical protein LBK60_01095 [Verrucomicrobiales bacterium]|nr:hypothetical protein [Verrucomicrobiales bacterium]
MSVIGERVILIGLAALMVSVWFAGATVIHGMDYLLKYRRSRQGLFSILCRTIFGVLWIILFFSALLIPATGPGLHPHKHMVDVSNAKQLGFRLFVHANDNNGKYPDDLAAFIKTEFTKKELASSEIKRLLYQKDGKQLRWILTPKLTTSDSSNVILLRSTEKFGNGKHEGLVYFTLGMEAGFIKDPDRQIITVSGTPMFRPRDTVSGGTR